MNRENATRCSGSVPAPIPASHLATKTAWTKCQSNFTGSGVEADLPRRRRSECYRGRGNIRCFTPIRPSTQKTPHTRLFECISAQRRADLVYKELNSARS